MKPGRIRRGCKYDIKVNLCDKSCEGIVRIEVSEDKVQ
jgi:hypothetical protein